MIRWLRIAATATVILTLIGLGVCIGLFLMANDGWVPIDVPKWLAGVFGNKPLEAFVPALIAGWLLGVVALVVLLGWSAFYVWRRRQYESLVHKLERELAELRNLPFKKPAPLEDLAEAPDADAAQHLARAADGEEALLPPARGEGAA